VRCIGSLREAPQARSAYIRVPAVQPRRTERSAHSAFLRGLAVRAPARGTLRGPCRNPRRGLHCAGDRGARPHSAARA